MTEAALTRSAELIFNDFPEVSEAHADRLAPHLLNNLCGVRHCRMERLLAPKPKSHRLAELVLLILIERDPKGVLRGRS